VAANDRKMELNMVSKGEVLVDIIVLYRNLCGDFEDNFETILSLVFS
jgi:hypothetical protein